MKRNAFSILDHSHAFFRRSIAAVLMFVVSSGCASMVQPVGAWSQPSELPLTSTSLAHVTTQVRCGTLQDDGQLRERASRICTYLEQSLSQLGTKIIKSSVKSREQRGDAAPADLTLWYLETTHRESRWSPYAWAAFAFTAGLVPTVITTSAEAELRVTDRRGLILDRETVRVDEVKTFGWLSLARLITAKTSKKRLQSNTERLFLTHVQNKIYSQAARLPLPTAVSSRDANERGEAQ